MGNRLINKPIRGASVNTSHPLSRNLVHGLPYNEYSGSPVNLFTQQVLTATTANIYWDMYGYYYGYDGSYLWEANASQHNIPSSAVTLYSFFGYLGTHTSSAGPVFKAHGSLVSYGIAFESVANSGKIQFHTEISSTARSTPLTSSAISSTSGSHIFGWWESGTPLYLEVIDIYGNLVYATESASSYSGIITYGTDAMYYGYNTTGISVADYTWSRALTASERMQVATDPWCMYRQPSKTMHFVPAPKKGLWVVDSHIPQSIDAGGFASDGAFHIDVDINQDAIIEIDTDRDDPSFVVHDPSIMTGSVVGPTEHLSAYYKCDDAAASTVVVATIGDNASWRNNTINRSVDAVRGKGLDQDDTSSHDYLTLPSSFLTTAFLKKGSVFLKVLPQFASTTSSDQYFFYLYYSSNDMIRASYYASTDEWRLGLAWGGTVVSAETVGAPFDGPISICIAWDSDYDFMSINVNGVMAVNVNTGTPTTSAPTAAYMGCYYNTTSVADYIFDEIKIYDAPILPYGSFVSGQQVDSGDYSKAHSDITAYVHGDESNSDSLKIGIGSITVTNATHGTGPDGVSNSAFLIDANSEVVSFSSTGNTEESLTKVSLWYKKTGTPNNLGRLFEFDADTDVTCYRDTSDTNIALILGSSYISFGSLPNIFDGNWHYIQAYWDDVENERGIYIDGVLEGSNSTMFAIPTLSGTSYIGNRGAGDRPIGGLIYGFTITNNPYTPPVPFVLGHGPVFVPTVENSKKVS